MTEDQLYYRYMTATNPAEKDKYDRALRTALYYHAEAVYQSMIREKPHDLITKSVQDVMYDILNYQEQNGSKFSTWVHSALKHDVLDEIKRRKCKAEIPLEDREGRLIELPVMDDPSVKIMLDDVLEQLDAGEQELLLAKLRGETDEELAVNEGCDRSTITHRWISLRKKLQPLFT